MSSSQNKVVRLYGPWKGVADSDGKGGANYLELGFNVYQDGDTLVSRNGIVPYGSTDSAVTTPRRLHAMPSGALVVTGNSTAKIDYGTTTTALTTDADWANGGLGKDCKIGRFVFSLDDDGKIVVFDEVAATANLLVPVTGTDTETYLSALPAFVWVEAYNDRLYGVTADGTVVFSQAPGDSAAPVDGTAPLGGLNLWKFSSNFDLGPTTASYGLKTMGGYLACFSSRRVALFDDAGPSLQDVPTGHGCVAPESIDISPRGVIYLAPDGVRVLAGATSTLVSDGVSKTIAENIPTGGLSPCYGIVVPSQKQYRLFVPIRESLYAQIALVWDFESGEWFMWGTKAPWQEQDGTYAVTSAVILPSVAANERLVTTSPGRVTFIHDVGDLDCTDHTSAGREIDWYVAFKVVGFGEDQGVAKWRDVRVEALSDATHIRMVALADGEKFEDGVGTTTSALGDYPYVQTEIANQSTWTSTAPADAPLYTGSSTASVPRWYSWRIPSAKIARTLQIVLWNGLVTPATARTPGVVSIRGVEIEARPHRGRR